MLQISVQTSAAQFPISVSVDADEVPVGLNVESLKLNAQDSAE